MEMQELHKLYGEELKKRIIKEPDEYMTTAEGAFALALKMLQKIQKGSVISLSANPALKTACKKLDITSYQALSEYIKGVEL